MDDNRITYFAETDARNKHLKFGIKAKDRTRHVYVIGKTGMGKSTMLENMAVQDIMNGEGMAFIDPHGKTADLLLEYVPKERIRDVIYLAPFDIEYPISFNVLENVEESKRHLVVSGLMSTFKKIWEDAWSARMEYILTNTLLALLETPGTTLLGVNRMLSDKEYRKEIVANIKDPSVRTFWVKEFANYTERMAAEAVPAIQNKVGQFTANPLIRNMIGQAQSSFDLRQVLDQRKILIINLSKGRIGDDNMKLLGGLIVTKIYLAAMSRADMPDRIMRNLPNFYLYVDEFQNFANASFADILSEARKYKLNLTIAHQYIEQMEENVSAAVFGNVGTMIAFRVGATDAEMLEKEFTPQFTLEDLVNLGFTQIYLKLMIDGLTSTPFSAVTLPPIPHPDTSYVNDIIAASREQFARARSLVEADIEKFHNPEPPKKALPPTPVPALATAPKPQVPASSFVPKNSKITITNNQETIPKQSQPHLPPKPALPVAPKPIAPASMSTAPAPVFAKPMSAASAPVAVPTPVSVPAKTNNQETIPKQPQPISLSSLSPKPSTKPDPKVASKEHVNELRNALQSLLKKSAPAPSTSAVPPVAAPAPKPATPTPAQEAANMPHEVPEDVLTHLLKVD